MSIRPTKLERCKKASEVSVWPRSSLELFMSSIASSSQHQPRRFGITGNNEKKTIKKKEQSSDSMVDKQNKTLLINSVMRSMSFSVLSNKEILGGQCDLTLKHWKVVFQSASTVVVVLSKASGILFLFFSRSDSRNKNKSKIQNSGQSSCFKAQREIFVKTNDGQNPEALGTVYN